MGEPCLLSFSGLPLNQAWVTLTARLIPDRTVHKLRGICIVRNSSQGTSQELPKFKHIALPAVLPSLLRLHPRHNQELNHELDRQGRSQG